MIVDSIALNVAPLSRNTRRLTDAEANEAAAVEADTRLDSDGSQFAKDHAATEVSWWNALESSFLQLTADQNAEETANGEGNGRETGETGSNGGNGVANGGNGVGARFRNVWSCSYFSAK